MSWSTLCPTKAPKRSWSERPLRLTGKVSAIEHGGFYVQTDWKGAQIEVLLFFSNGRRLLTCNGREDRTKHRYGFKRRLRPPKEVRIEEGRDIYFQVMRHDLRNGHTPTGKLWGVVSYTREECEAIEKRHRQQQRRKKHDRRYNNDPGRRGIR